MRSFRILSGLLVWACVFVALLWTLNTQIMSQGSVTGDLVPSLWRYAAGKETHVELKMDSKALTAVGDQIFIIHDDQTLTQVGRIARVGPAPGATGDAALFGIYTDSVQARIFPGTVNVPAGATLSFYETDDSFAWMVRTLIPPEKRAIITKEINDAIATHRDEILAALLPIVNDTLTSCRMHCPRHWSVTRRHWKSSAPSTRTRSSRRSSRRW